MKNTAIFGFMLVACTMAFPSISHAQIDFGGLVVAEVPCTCSPFTMQWFAPLYIDSALTTGPLSVPDTPFLYPYYYSIPGSWDLGFFTPGVQACFMLVPHPPWCVPSAVLGFPALGLITPFTGSSL